MRVACVNQDAGVSPDRRKGAAVHLQAMRRAFEGLGAGVVALDQPDDGALCRALDAAAAGGPLDLVYERYALGRCTASRWASARGVPLVLEANAPLADEHARYRGVEPAEGHAVADRMAFGSAALVLAVSEAVADYAEGRGAARARIAVVPNAVDPELFRPREPRDPLRATVAPEERLVLGFHGRLRPWHGFERFAEAARRLLEEGADVHLLLVGEGEFEPHLADIPAGRVTRVAWVPHEEVGRWVACMDALPLTYGADAPCYFSPLKLPEAMAAGVVPVAPRLGELPAQLGHGRAGVLYEPGDAGGLVAALRDLSRQPDLRARLSQAAVAAARRHTWAGVAESVLARLGLRCGAQP